MENIYQGLILLLAGMGIVFAFLIVLVIVTSLSSKQIAKLSYLLPDEQPKKAPAPKAAATDDDLAIALAIAVARAR